MSELSDAVARMRADEYGFHNEHDYSRPVGLQELDDLRTIRDAYLTEHPAEDSVNQRLLDAAEKLFDSVQHIDVGQAEWSEFQNAITAARAQADDDAMPVDEAWLRSIGFSGNYTLRISEEITASPQVCFRKFEIGDTCWIQNKDPIKSVITNIEIPRPKTRGDVRRLLAALGVEK